MRGATLQSLFTNCKNSKNHPVYEDKSDSRGKVVVVRGTLI